MWFIKAFLGLVVLAALLYVASLNLQERMDVYLLNPDIPTFTQIRATWALLAAFGAGVLVWFLGSLFQVLAAKSETAGLRRKNRQLARELTDLRNMTVKDIDPKSIPEDGPAEDL